jgi:hypothetical protein
MEDAAGTEVVVLAEWVRHGVAEERGQAVLAALVPHLSGGSDGGDDVERYEDDDSPSPAEFRAVQRLMPWLFADTTPRGCLAFLLEELPCATSPAPAQLGCHTATSLMMTKEEVFAALAPVVLQRFIAGVHARSSPANIAIAVQRELTHMCVIVCVRVRVRVRCDYAAGMRLVKALDKSGFTAPKPLADCLMQLTHHENQDVRQTLARRLPWIGLPLESYHSVPSLCLPHCWLKLFFFFC